MTANRRTARRIPGVQTETEVALNRIIDQLSARLEALEAKPVDPQTLVADFLASERQTLTLEAPPAGMNGTLVQATRFNKGQRITFFQRNANPVRFRAINGTVNGVPLVISNARGTYDAVSDGAGGWALNQNITSAGVVGLPGTPGTIGPMGFKGDQGDQGEQGDQGFPGRQGDPGATGPTGPSGSGSFSLPPFCIASDNADEPPEYIPRGWANALASNPRSGGNNAFWDVGQFANFGLDGPTTGAPQLRSGDAIFRMRGSQTVVVTGDTGVALNATNGSAQVNAFLTGQVSLSTASVQRLVIEQTGEWSTPLGSSGQVLTHQGGGVPPAWATPASGSSARDALLPLLTSVPDNAEEPSFIPRPGWSAALRSWPRSGGASAFMDLGDSLFFQGSSATALTLAGVAATNNSVVTASGDLTISGGNPNLSVSRSGGLEALDLTTQLLTISAVGVTGQITAKSTAGFFIQNAAGINGFLDVAEAATSALTVAAGHGQYWVRNDAPNLPMFTDDTNVDCPIKNSVAHKTAATAVGGAAGSISVLDCTGTFTIPANTLVVGSRFRLDYTFQFTRGATATAMNVLNFLTVGANSISVTNLTNTAAATYQGRVFAEFTVLTTGAGGTCMATLTMSGPASTVAEGAAARFITNLALACNTTIALAIVGSAQMSAVVTNTTLTATGGQVEWLA